MQQRPIRFFHRGAIVEIAAAAPTRTVLEWLREDAHCSGTKEGCNEGDCGACTVVIGEAVHAGHAAHAAHAVHAGDAGGDGSAGSGSVRGLVLRSVNACIRFLPTLDGKALFTVEDLQAVQAADPDAAPRDALHPVQRAMVDCHASQCGFCTPGFVMSLWSAYERHRAAGTRPSRQQLADELSGNLCRCTGYRPILDAAERMFDLAPTALDAAPVLAALESFAADAALSHRAAGSRFDAPRTLDDLAALRLERPQARLVAGSTDVGLWVTKMFRELPDLIHLGEVAELRRIEVADNLLRIGAGASIEDAFRTLVCRWPGLEDVWLRFAGVPIRNAATLGGNVANGSPIGDSAPVLMALDAVVVLRRGHVQRRLALADFYVSYMRSRLEPGEFVQAVEVPLARTATVRAYKISKRFDCDISAVCAGLAIALDGELVSHVRFAFGGMAATVRRAAAAEAAVLGQAWSEATLAAAQLALATDFTPLDDMRASAAYRLQVSRNLLRRFWLETRSVEPLPASALSVWSVMAHVEASASAPASA